MKEAVFMDQEQTQFMTQFEGILDEEFECLGYSIEIEVLCSDLCKYNCTSLELVKEYLNKNAEYYNEWLVDHVLAGNMDEM